MKFLFTPWLTISREKGLHKSDSLGKRIPNGDGEWSEMHLLQLERNCMGHMLTRFGGLMEQCLPGKQLVWVERLMRDARPVTIFHLKIFGNDNPRKFH